jgi:ABC-2 type transport system permease protein
MAVTLLKLEFKSLIRGLVLWTGILALILIGLMAFFPLMEGGVISDLVGANRGVLPMPLLALFGLSRVPIFSNVTIYFAFVMQYINVAVAIYASLRGAASLNKEEREGTIAYLYAQPITRSGIVAEKMAANFLAYGILMVILWAFALILALIFSTGSQAVGEMLFAVIQIGLGTFVIGIVFMALGFFFSATLSSLRKARIVAITLVLGTYLMGVISSLADAVEFLKVLSPLTIFEPSRILARGIDLSDLGLWGGMVVIMVVMTFVRYNKKDFKIT